jgi:hypothetical protein
MSFWNTVSRATQFGRGAGGGGGGQPAAAVSGRWHRARPWVVLAVVAYVLWAIWSGSALVFVDQLVAQLLRLLPATTILLALIAILGISFGVAALKAPAETWIAKYGKRLIVIAPIGLGVAAILIPTVAIVLSLTSSGVGKLEQSFLGQKPAASLCTAAGLTDPASQPAAAPTPHR